MDMKQRWNEESMKQRWKELSPGKRRMIIVAASIDLALRVAALIDLRRRPAGQIRGSKKAWAAGVALVNSAGTLPISYFLFGRRRVA